jgi:hypothetical protein
MGSFVVVVAAWTDCHHVSGIVGVFKPLALRKDMVDLRPKHTHPTCHAPPFLPLPYHRANL